MIISCPTCTTRFLVSPTAIGEGRTVRCGKCKRAWWQAPPADMDARLAAAVPEQDLRPLSAGSNLPAFPEQVRRRGGGRKVALAAAVIVLIAAGTYYRSVLFQNFPSSGDLLALAGLADEPTVSSGLNIRDRVASWQVEDKDRVLMIQGVIANRSQKRIEVPKLRAVLEDDRRQVLQRWTFTVPATALEPGETVPFKTSVRNPPASASGIVVDFLASAE